MAGTASRPWLSSLLGLALGASLLVPGCVYSGWPFRRGEPLGRPVPDRTDGGSDQGVGMVAPGGPGWKVVTGKREPHFLVARDGTECTVTAGRWEQIAIGERAFCIWGTPR